MIIARRTPRTGISLKRELVPFCVAFLATLSLGGSGFSAISVAVFTYSLVWYIDALGKELAIVPAIALIASAQWMLGPAIYYTFEGVAHYKYYMYVDEITYFSYVFPATLAFILGLRVFFPVILISQIRSYLDKYSGFSLKSAYNVFLFGLFCSLVTSYAPSALRFALFLGSQTVFISVIYFFALKSKWRWIALFVVFGMQLVNSTEQGLFHDLLLWSALTLSFVFSEIRLRFPGKAIVVLIGILMILQLQMAKAQYRLLISLSPSQAGIMTLAGSMLQNGFLAPQDQTASELNWGELNARINQGWIISATMKHVPSNKDFEYGSTIALAVRDALLPRLLVDKRTVRVSDYFSEYTGLHVNQNTSFGISVLGEAWVNFGHFGVVFMFLFGGLYGIIFRGLLRVTKYYPTIILWSPLLFLQAVKSETEFVVVLNHMIKSGIFVLLIYFFLNKFLRLRI